MSDEVYNDLKTTLDTSSQLISWNLQQHTRSTSDFWKQGIGTRIHIVVILSIGLGAKGGTRITYHFGTLIAQDWYQNNTVCTGTGIAQVGTRIA
jgi:hypothetical protein